MDSIRLVASCIGIGGDFSILKDFLGFRRGVLPPDPTGAPVVISLKRQLQLLHGKFINVNVIAVGSDQFTDDDRIQLDFSVLKLRDIFRQVSLGVGRVEHHNISTAEADGLDNPVDLGEVTELINEFAFDNDGIDVFFPHNWMVTEAAGYNPETGVCDNGGGNTGGAGIELNGSEQTARTCAHEIGHYLSLSHPPESEPQPDNLMTQSDDITDPFFPLDSVDLTNSQGKKVRKHCVVRDGC